MWAAGSRSRSPVEDITLLEVIEAVEGPLCINECLQTPAQCGHVRNCPAFPYLCEAQERLRETLDVSFAAVVAGPDAGSDPSAVGAPAVVSAEGFGWGAGNGQGKRARTADPAARGEA